MSPLPEFTTGFPGRARQWFVSEAAARRPADKDTLDRTNRWKMSLSLLTLQLCLPNQNQNL